MGALADRALGMRMGFALILMLISIIGGRIIPAFTRNWLMRQGHAVGLPTMANRFDIAVIGVTALALAGWVAASRSEEHTSELQSLMRISYAVFCLKKKNNQTSNIKYRTVLTCNKVSHTKASHQRAPCS